MMNAVLITATPVVIADRKENKISEADIAAHKQMLAQMDEAIRTPTVISIDKIRDIGCFDYD